MSRSLAGVALAALLTLAGSARGADDPPVVQVWPPGRPPGDFGEIGAETFRPPPKGATDGSRWLTNVTKPTLTVYRPPRAKDTGAAVLICPGGGYWDLAWELEGEEIAAWFNSVGVSGIILKYRVPRRPGQPERLPAPLPLQDAQRAVSLAEQGGGVGHRPEADRHPRLLRRRHLALATATNFDRRSYEPIDEVDRVSCRPDFAVAVYPGYLVEKGTDRLAPYVRIPAETPPVFLVHAADDRISEPENSVVMFQALRKAGVPAELHVYAAGGHGFGVRRARPAHPGPPVAPDWLRASGTIPPDPGR